MPVWNLKAVYDGRFSSAVSSGLVAYYDAGNLSSYPGTGTTWFDLSGNGNNLTATNSPTFNSSGYWSTGASGYFTGAGSSSIPIGNSNYTMQVWARVSSWSTSRGLISIGGFGTTNQSNALRMDTSTLGYMQHYWWGNDLTIANNNGNIVLNTWFMVTAQFDGTNRRVWANVVNVSNDTPAGHNVTSTTIQLAKTYSTEYLSGDIAIAQIYNRALSQAEIAQNYYSFRERFGL